jgi:MFS transporter, putative metabolite:H+ symporter
MGPLGARHLRSRAFRNAASTSRVTSTYWPIAWANGLGWGFDGMDGTILPLVAPLLMKEFAIGLGTYRGGVQIAHASVPSKPFVVGYSPAAAK